MKIFFLLFLASSAAAIKIQCRFSSDYSLVILNQVYTCDVRAMDFSDNPTTITGFTGSHLAANFTNADVKFITFENYCLTSSLATVPRGFLNFFPNFVAFRFSNCAMSPLTGNEFVDYPNLQWVVFYRVNHTRVPGNLFKPTPNIKLVNFYENKIQHVGEGLLSNLTSLQEVYFEKNICVNQNAYGASQIANLAQVLRDNCPDIDVTTVKTTTTTLAPSGNCDAYITKIVELTTKLGDQAAILQQKEIELAQIKQENAILKATC